MKIPPSNSGKLQKARLSWTMADGDMQSLELIPATSVSIGRTSDNTIAWLDTRVSRLHAEIYHNGVQYCIQDQGSANGTFINGKRILGEKKLKDQDEIRIGPLLMRFDMETMQENQPGNIDQSEEVTQSTHRSTLVVGKDSPMAYLEIQGGEDAGRSIELDRERMTVGRSGRKQQWDIILQDRAVSRPQADFIRQGNSFVLEDLKSANGTLLNGEMIDKPQLLKDGDVITFGETVVIFHLNEE